MSECHVRTGAGTLEVYHSALVSLWRSGRVDECLSLMHELKTRGLNSDTDVLERIGKVAKIVYDEVGTDIDDDTINDINSEYSKRYGVREEESPYRNREMDFSAERPDSVANLMSYEMAENRSRSALAKIHPRFHGIFREEMEGLRGRIANNDGNIKESMERNLAKMNEIYDRIVSKRRDKFDKWSRCHVLCVTTPGCNNPYTRYPNNLSNEEYDEYETVYALNMERYGDM